jgi:hypothetical protein
MLYSVIVAKVFHAFVVSFALTKCIIYVFPRAKHSLAPKSILLGYIIPDAVCIKKFFELEYAVEDVLKITQHSSGPFPDKFINDSSFI